MRYMITSLLLMLTLLSALPGQAGELLLCIADGSIEIAGIGTCLGHGGHDDAFHRHSHGHSHQQVKQEDSCCDHHHAVEPQVSSNEEKAPCTHIRLCGSDPALTQQRSIRSIRSAAVLNDSIWIRIADHAMVHTPRSFPLPRGEDLPDHLSLHLRTIVVLA